MAIGFNAGARHRPGGPDLDQVRHGAGILSVIAFTRSQYLAGNRLHGQVPVALATSSVRPIAPSLGPAEDVLGGKRMFGVPRHGRSAGIRVFLLWNEQSGLPVGLDCLQVVHDTENVGKVGSMAICKSCVTCRT
jgi:hypothetical protein